MAWWSARPDGAGKAGTTAATQKFGEEAFALTCLALELAKSDDDYSGDEMRRLSSDLAHHFDLSDREVEELLSAAETHQAQAVETYAFTRTLRQNLTLEDREVVVETLWRLAYADGVLDGEEFAFMRTVPAALGVEPQVSAAARRRAMVALGLDSTGE